MPPAPAPDASPSPASRNAEAPPSATTTAPWDATPIVLVHGTRVRAATAAAARRGVHPGMTLPQARAACDPLAVLPWDDEALARETARASAAFLAASPQVTPAADAPGLWWIGAHGFEGVGGEGTLAALLLALARAWHPRARVAVADTAVAARAATWSTRAATAPLHLAPGDDPTYLAAVPLALLPMDDELRTTLGALGLRTAGAFAALAPQDVERRWGAEGLAVWRLARGDDPRRATLARPDDPHVITHDLPAPVHTTEPLLFVVRAALDRLVRALAAEGRAVAAVALTLTCDGDRPRRVTREVRPAAPIARTAPLFERCRALLDAWPLDAPVCAVEVRIARAATAPAEQGDLLAPTWRDPAAAEAALARLRAAFGTAAVVRPVTRDSHAPERAGAWEAIETVRAPAPSDARPTTGGPSMPASLSHEAASGASPVARRRLDPPEAIAVTVDATGTPQEIRWRGDRLRVVRAEGPERLSGAWWQPAPFARDHWRCASTGGDLLCYRDATGWWLQGWDD
ncbi:MAG: hypothetical protein P3A32_06670 [Gemmatimonadota bacterium]|nr:hypothetical protein [Gemmatimonadota bacterium]MDQ8177154.1 hypothetical protein [Gemmatimonadota bacterium]